MWIPALALAAWQTLTAQPTRLALELEDYVQMPITGELDGQNTRGQLARVNFLRDEPGGRRFFVNDLNGPLYIVDKQTKTFTTYLDFNGAGGRPGLFQKFTFERNFATGLINFQFDPDYPRNGVFYTHSHGGPGDRRAPPRRAAGVGRRPRPVAATRRRRRSRRRRRTEDRARSRADRVEGSQPRERDVRGHGARAAARAAAVRPFIRWAR